MVETAQSHQKALALYRPSAARPMVDAIEARFPDHAGVRYLRAIQDLEDGRTGRALTNFRKLLEEYPQSPAVRVRLMSACRSLGDMALLRETLRAVVDTGMEPGVDSQSVWVMPHQRYFCEYADLLRLSSETQGQAESLLRSVLKASWRSASAWHVLADLRWTQGDMDSAQLAYRIASTLAEHDEHYAYAYADVLCRRHRLQEAIEWLRSRAESLGNSLQGVSTWVTYVSLLEDWGDPSKALEICRYALGRFGASPSLLAFAIPFLARMGEWQEAEQQLQSLEASEGRGYFHQAAVYFNDMRGLTARALEHAEAWVKEFPRSTYARNALLGFISRVHGQPAALDRATKWMREHPENENFEETFCQYADYPLWKKLRVLRVRARRNPEDAWAWRELVFDVIELFQKSDEVHRRRLEPVICSYFAEADRVSTEDAATIRAHGVWNEAQGNWTDAIACYLESVRREPGNFYGYRRAFDSSSRSSGVERRKMWASLEPVWLQSPGHLPNCLEMTRLLTDAFGPRETEQIIAGWQKLRSDDPNVQEAMADLLLDHGHGRTDAIRALELLRPAVEHYPYHSGLRFSLAKAYRATGDDSAAEQVFEELVRRRPDNIAALIQLAWIHQRRGETEQALRVLAVASDQEPQSPDPPDARAQALIEDRRYEEAHSAVEESLQKLPLSVRMYERAIALFSSCGDYEKAVEAARQGTRAYPRGAYMWLLLGRTLRERPQVAASGEIEECFRRSLRLNSSLYEPADWLSVLLTEQRRYGDATEVISALEPRLADPSPAQGRKAWIKRQTGSKREAATDLSEILQKFPGFTWGWNVLLTWFEEDEDWALIKTVLGPVPPQMLSDVAFRRQRLLLLEKAKAETGPLDAEWGQLLKDFPEDVSLHLYRYDSLRDAERWEEAAATLERIEPLSGDDVYLMARLVDVKSHERRFDEALELAMRVCFAPVEQSTWPVDRIWEVLGKADKVRTLAVRFRTKLEEGAQPTRRALSRFVEYVVDEKKSARFLRALRQTRLHHVPREMISLMKLIERSSWRDDFRAADLFAILTPHGYPRLVVRFWKQMCDQGAYGDSDAWAEAGRAMVDLRHKRSARKLLEDWRGRRGVRMWSLANYLQCLSRLSKRNLEEVIRTCNDALAELPHDHCARYLAHMQAEACALAGEESGLVKLWNDWRGYFGDDLKPGEYFRTAYKHLLYEIPDMVDALQRNDRKSYRKILWRVRFHRYWNEESRPRARKIVRIVLLLVLTWIIGMMVGVFRR